MARDGRKLRLETKPKTQLAISRFMSRGGGFLGAAPDASLADVGLEDLIPTNFSRTPGPPKLKALASLCRTTADFIFRYVSKTHSMVQEATEATIQLCSLPFLTQGSAWRQTTQSVPHV